MQRTLCPSRNLGVWQIVSNKKFVNDKLVSGKLSKVLLNERLLVHNFQNSCSTEYHWTHVTQKSIEIWLYNKYHKIRCVILTISYLRAWTIETSSSPNDSMKPLIQQIEIFSGILTAKFKCKYFSTYTRELLGCLLGISPSGRYSRGGTHAYSQFKQVHVMALTLWSKI